MNDWQEDPKAHAVWDAVLLLCCPALFACLSNAALTRFGSPAVLFVLLLATFRTVYLRRVLVCPVVTAAGGMCYTVYLIHYQVISFVGRCTKDVALTRLFWVNLLAQALLVGFATLAVSAVWFLLIEKPCMQKDWPQRLLAWLCRIVRADGTSGPPPSATVWGSASATRDQAPPPRGAGAEEADWAVAVSVPADGRPPRGEETVR